MKKTFLSLCALTILSVSAFTSCGGGMEAPENGGGGVTPPAVIPVTSITLSSTTINLWNGKTATRLTATVLPDNATDKTITWTNAHPEFATFDPATGIITPTGFGITTITATANGATKVDATAGNCTVKVTDYPNTAARDVALMSGGTVVGNIEWAPVNCGTDDTHPMGKYYQWGRKEGFTYVEPVGGNNQTVSPGILGPKPEADAFGSELVSTFIYTYG